MRIPVCLALSLPHTHTRTHQHITHTHTSTSDRVDAARKELPERHIGGGQQLPRLTTHVLYDAL